MAGSSVRGWLDGSLDTHNWLKLIRSTHNKGSCNVRHFLQGGQVNIRSKLEPKRVIQIFQQKKLRIITISSHLAMVRNRIGYTSRFRTPVGTQGAVESPGYVRGFDVRGREIRSRNR